MTKQTTPDKIIEIAKAQGLALRKSHSNVNGHFLTFKCQLGQSPEYYDHDRWNAAMELGKAVRPFYAHTSEANWSDGHASLQVTTKAPQHMIEGFVYRTEEFGLHIYVTVE